MILVKSLDSTEELRLLIFMRLLPKMASVSLNSLFIDVEECLQCIYFCLQFGGEQMSEEVTLLVN